MVVDDSSKTVSDAWPEERRGQVSQESRIHAKAQILAERYSREEILSRIYFRELETRDVPELRLQHKEWYPLSYPDSYYEKTLKKEKIVKIGCFISIHGLDLSEKDE